jgi:hypothetical protein
MNVIDGVDQGGITKVVGVNPKKIAQQLAIVLLGVVVPITILTQAYYGIASLGSNVNYIRTTDDLVSLFSNAKKIINNDKDYALFSLLNSEHANLKTMTNKQIMKVAIMQIGFAVTSLGMMFIVLGINDGGASGGTEVSGIKFDFKSESTGVVVFVIGALMATAGGVLKNDYNTVPIPEFVVGAHPEYTESVNAYIECKKLGEDRFKDCFVGVFEEINQGALK